MNISINEVANEEEAVIKTLRKMKAHSIVDLFGPVNSASLCKAFKSIECVEDVKPAIICWFDEHLKQGVEISEEMVNRISVAVVERAWDMALAKQEKRYQDNAELTERKLSNRITYQMESVMSFQESYNKQGEFVKHRWHGHTDLKSAGLLRLAVEAEIGAQDRPPLFSIQNHLPMEVEINDDGSVQQRRKKIPVNAWKKMFDQDVAVSGGKIGYIKSSPAWKWLKQLFPKVIDARAYNHSLNAPILPGGFQKLKVQLRDIKTVDSDGNVVSAQTDGCGRIHPEHPLFEQMQRPGGASVFQFRFLNLKGLFCKGILVPDERCVSVSGEPEIWVDFNQIKGRHKNYAKQHIGTDFKAETEGYIGVLQAWDRPRELKWSFEQLQMFHTCPETAAIIEKWVDSAYEEMLSMGIEGLLAGIATDNPGLKLMLEMIAAINDAGIKLHATQIPTIKNAVIERLQKVLYFIAQGAGKNGKQVVAVIDNGIPEGYCVARGYKPGSEVIVHRYPTLLPQGILKLKVMKPLPHHIVDGKVVRECVFMNTRDLTDKAQGDSDGDIVGITNDPEALELFNYRLGDERVFMVEPDGEKFDMETGTDAANEYMAGDPRGNVGGMCLHQAKMFAVGDVHAAIAMAFPYQEAVDSAKKKMRFTDWRRAANLDNWEEKQGRLYFYDRLPEEEYEDGELPEKLIAKWINGRLNLAGIMDTKEQNVLAWRSRDKRIKFTEWESTGSKGCWNGGNLVHHCHDYAREVWKQYEEMFCFDAETVEIGDVLKQLLNAKGLDFEVMRPNWYEYRNGLRTKSGLRDFGKRMHKIMSSDLPEEERQNQIDIALICLNAELAKLSLPEFECIWYMENTSWYQCGKNEFTTVAPEGNTEEKLEKMRVNNPNHAFRVVTAKNSKIMQLLEIEESFECEFLTGKNASRIEKVVAAAMISDDAPKRLIEIIHNSTLHSVEIKDENQNPVHGRDCVCCSVTLQNALVMKMRKQRSGAEYDFIREFATKINK